MVWRAEDPQGNETGKIRWEVIPYTRGRGLDVGCGPQKLWATSIGVDSGIDTELFGIQMAPDVRTEAHDLSMFADGSMDYVFSSHCLEHIQDFKRALKEWWRVIKDNGHLVLYLPHKALYPNIGTKGSNPDHKHDFTESDIIKAMSEIAPGWLLLEKQQRNDDQEYSFLVVFQKSIANEQVWHVKDHATPISVLKNPWDGKTPTAGVVRYGAFGDLIQASSVFAALKAEGFYVTVLTTPRGWEIAKHDPNVDAAMIQDNDQVPNEALGLFWKHWSKKFDRWVNLSETVEGALLSMPNRASYLWSTEARHMYMNHNYVQFQHAIAQVPYEKPLSAFYETDEEREWATAKWTELGGKPRILWALSGSSVHKAWPYMDEIIARIMLTFDDARVVTVGDELSQLLEQGWQNEKRVVPMAGKMDIRRTLALAKQADIVIGPETGVLNAVAMLPMAKIITLSHSTHENLTRDWVNTYSIASQKTPCYPCHQMHYGFQVCKRNEELGVAQCQADIPADAVWAAFITELAALAEKERNDAPRIEIASG